MCLLKSLSNLAPQLLFHLVFTALVIEKVRERRGVNFAFLGEEKMKLDGYVKVVMCVMLKYSTNLNILMKCMFSG